MSTQGQIDALWREIEQRPIALKHRVKSLQEAVKALDEAITRLTILHQDHGARIRALEEMHKLR